MYTTRVLREGFRSLGVADPQRFLCCKPRFSSAIDQNQPDVGHASFRKTIVCTYIWQTFSRTPTPTTRSPRNRISSLSQHLKTSSILLPCMRVKIYPPIHMQSCVHTFHDCVSPPSAGLKVISNSPGPGAMKSVALYWSPNACLPTTMGLVHPGFVSCFTFHVCRFQFREIYIDS